MQLKKLHNSGYIIIGLIISLMFFYFGYSRIASMIIVIKSLGMVDMFNSIIHSINTGLLFIEISTLILIGLVIYCYLKNKN